MIENSTSGPDKLKPGQETSDGLRQKLRRIARSFGFASQGVVNLVRTETNAQVHLVVSALVFLVGILFGLSRAEWSLLFLAMGLVWGLEGMNTALERLADAVHPDQHPLVRQAKDAAAGAVLLGAMAAAMVGLIILLPRPLFVLIQCVAWIIDRFD